MQISESLYIAAQIADEQKLLDKLLVVGVRIDGSLLILDTGLTDEDVDGLYKDFRLWFGERLGREITSKA